MAVEKEIGLFAHLCRQRNGAAKVFPHCGEKGFAFSRRVQGFKLSEASLKALKKRLRRKMSFVLNYLKELDREYYSKWFKNILL